MKDYFNTETSPRVFEHGTVSIVANQDGAGLHIGVHEIEQVLSLELSLGEKPTLEVIFKKPKNKEEALKIEEHKRMVASINWIKVR